MTPSAAAALCGQTVLAEHRLDRVVWCDDALVVFEATSVLDGGTYTVTVATEVPVDTAFTALEDAVVRAARQAVGLSSVKPLLRARGVQLEAAVRLAVVRRGPSGEPLALRIERGSCSCAEAVRALEPLAAALARLHEQGAVHGAISAVTVSALDESLALDAFGLSVAADAACGARGTRDVLPRYARPPEALVSSPSLPGPWSDTHALALLVVQMLAGRLDVVALASPPTPSALGLLVPVRFDAALASMLAPSPSQRPVDLLAAFAALREAANDPLPASPAARASSHARGASAVWPSTTVVGGAPEPVTPHASHEASSGSAGAFGPTHPEIGPTLPESAPQAPHPDASVPPPARVLEGAPTPPRGVGAEPAASGSGRLVALVGVCALLMIGGMGVAIVLTVVRTRRPPTVVTVAPPEVPIEPPGASTTSPAPTPSGGGPSMPTAAPAPAAPSAAPLGRLPSAGGGPTYPADRDALVPVEPGDAVRGSRDALLTVALFVDLGCPFSARAMAGIPALEARYGEDLRVVIKHFPLPGRPGSRDAAEAAALVVERGTPPLFWGFVEGALRSGSPDAGRLEELGIKAGLPAGAVTDALTRHTHQARVERDIDLGRRLGVRGTPTLFFNGRRVDGLQPQALLERYFDAEVRRARDALAKGTPRDRLYVARVVANVTTAEGEREPDDSPRRRRTPR